MVQKLSASPISGDYEEIIFDLPGPWRKQIWNYAKFTTSNGAQWCGCFRAEDSHNFLVGELEKEGVACIVSGGHGYIIDIEKKKKLKDLRTDRITDLYVDEENNIFYISRLWDVKYVDIDLNEVDMTIPFCSDGIYFKDKVNKSLYMEVIEIGADLKKNFNYYISLDEKKIKKRRGLFNKVLEFFSKN